MTSPKHLPETSDYYQASSLLCICEAVSLHVFIIAYRGLQPQPKYSFRVRFKFLYHIILYFPLFM